MASEQFKWRGNGSISPTQGFPLEPSATWPVGHQAVAMWSSKNLLWIFGGANAAYHFGDLSTYSDGKFFFICVNSC